MFDWAYDLLRSRYERQMIAAADQMLSEAREAGLIK